VHHLLSHQSGIPDHTNDPNDLGEDRTSEDVLAWAIEQPLEFSPGSRMEYSNTGYVLIALLIERVAEQSFQSFLEERIFDPLGMEDSVVPEDEPWPPSIADGAISYASLDLPVRWPNLILLRTVGDRGQYSSLNDLKRFELALRNNTLVTAETMELMTSSDVDYFWAGDPVPDCKVGYGWFICDREGEPVNVWNQGSHFGFRTAFDRAPGEHVVSIMVSNGTFDWAQQLAYDLYRLYLDLDPVDI
jgi:CubicO group peptidase (beta-lactamase class C family)